MKSWKSRKYLTTDEMQVLLREVSQHTDAARNACMIYMAFIHGLRASELTGLTLADYDPLSHKLRVQRLKSGMETIHPVPLKEQCLIRAWLQERQTFSGHTLPWLFRSRQGKRLSRQRLYTLVKQSGKAAGITVNTHPHMLRHACGYGLAERGNDTRLIQDYLGHSNIRHTVRYTVSNAARFQDAWGTTPTGIMAPCDNICQYPIQCTCNAR